MQRPPSAKNKPLKLGDLMVREGLLTPDALQKALVKQKQTGMISDLGQPGHYKPLGLICVEMKLITKQDLQRFLSRHHKRIQIGELMINLGLINQEQLNHVLEQQRFSSNRFGTLLVQSGIISEQQLTQALSMQLDIPRILPSPELIDPELLKGIDEQFLRQHECLPVHRYGNQMVVVMSDPLNSELLQTLLDRFQCKITPAIAPASEILNTLSYLFKPRRKAKNAPDPNHELDEKLLKLSHHAKPTKEQASPIAHFLIRSAVEAGATALHLESLEKFVRLRFRVEGVLKHRTDLPLRLGPPLLDCIKTPFRIKREDYWQERITTTIGRQQVELKISFFSGMWGENLVLHITYIPPRLLGLEDMGFSPHNLQKIETLLNGAGGILLAACPHRSGKSTLLYAAIAHLNHPGSSILTLEDAVDYAIPGVVQNHFGAGGKDSYSALIEAMNDYDSDVVMVGEFKDQGVSERIDLAALNGKKVLAALNACDTTAALHRLQALQATHFLTTPVPLLLVSQRLVRKLCEQCKTGFVPSSHELKALKISPAENQNFLFWRASGCEDCAQEGYKGMTALHEILEINESLRQALRRGLTASGLRELARSGRRMISMNEDGIYKVIQGMTSLEEVQRVTVPHEGDALGAVSLREIVSSCEGRNLA
ncbi:MAG: GspE/PulE family protein [Candidatus Sericytochromatia bacterium]